MLPTRIRVATLAVLTGAVLAVSALAGTAAASADPSPRCDVLLGSGTLVGVSSTGGVTVLEGEPAPPTAVGIPGVIGVGCAVYP